MTDEPEFPEHVHKAFEAALVACMDYFRGVWADKDREIAALKKRVEECETELTRIKRRPMIDKIG